MTMLDECLAEIAKLSDWFKEPRATTIKLNQATYSYFLKNYTTVWDDVSAIRGCGPAPSLAGIDMFVDHEYSDGEIAVFDQYTDLMQVWWINIS